MMDIVEIDDKVLKQEDLINVVFDASGRRLYLLKGVGYKYLLSIAMKRAMTFSFKIYEIEFEFDDYKSYNVCNSNCLINIDDVDFNLQKEYCGVPIIYGFDVE